ncbi:unnamed protein product [Cylindrotheca closterium]|uniref:Uncharacterized protein n=1 Tax=Cylindrotheca closterium TaxID=2856 RepID=A0AAD2PXA3_9STRA|nr:unnamed protein product [Cylindrotheca closterium]
MAAANDNDKSNGATMRFVDIGANLLDDRYMGEYNGKLRHDPDYEDVLQRSVEAGITHLILTAGTLRESRRALALVRELRQKWEEYNKNNNNDSSDGGGGGGGVLHFGCTIGVHPTRCQQEFVDRCDPEYKDEDANDDMNLPPHPNDPQQVLEELKALAVEGQKDQSVWAIGEFGLDYDRLEFCSKEIQQEYFQKQLQTFQSAPELQDLPFFLHNRNVGRDLAEILRSHNTKGETTSVGCKGVVHSFDGSIELANEFIEMGLYIGLNGCSLKTEENLQVVQQIPLDKILLETDCPYCDVKATHAGYSFVKTKWESKNYKKYEKGKMVKGRNEPCQIVQVAEVIAGVKDVSVETVADACYANSMALYGF